MSYSSITYHINNTMQIEPAVLISHEFLPALKTIAKEWLSREVLLMQSYIVNLVVLAWLEFGGVAFLTELHIFTLRIDFPRKGR